MSDLKKSFFISLSNLILLLIILLLGLIDLFYSPHNGFYYNLYESTVIIEVFIFVSLFMVIVFIISLIVFIKEFIRKWNFIINSILYFGMSAFVLYNSYYICNDFTERYAVEFLFLGNLVIILSVTLGVMMIASGILNLYFAIKIPRKINFYKNRKDAINKINELKELYDKEIINENEYIELRAKYIDKL